MPFDFLYLLNHGKSWNHIGFSNWLQFAIEKKRIYWTRILLCQRLTFFLFPCSQTLSLCLIWTDFTLLKQIIVTDKVIGRSLFVQKKEAVGQVFPMIFFHLFLFDNFLFIFSCLFFYVYSFGAYNLYFYRTQCLCHFELCQSVSLTKPSEDTLPICDKYKNVKLWQILRLLHFF